MQYPLFQPPTEWVMPDGYPDLTGHKEVAIDLETRDPNLTTMGSGWARKDGHIIGVAVAVEGDQWYFPIRHEIGPNFDAKRTLGWLQDVCKIDRDYIGNVTQAGVKKGKFTKEKRGVNKIMLALLETAGQLNENIAGSVQKHRQITKDFQDDAIKEISKNESFKAAVLDKCKENLPLQDILEGKEIMAAGQTPVTRKSLTDMFGTDKWEEVKEKTSVDAGPPPSLVYTGDIEGKPPIKFANINIREDGQGYSGGPGAIKFEIKFNNNFRDNANNSADDIYTEFRPEGGQIPIRYKKTKKSD